MPDRAILDVRPAARFLLGHARAAANIPLEDLAARGHELPPRDVPIAIVDEEAARAASAAELLRARGFDAVVIPPSETGVPGPALEHLWRPNAFLEASLERLRPARGRALDLACGSGRDAVFLATKGFSVEAVDILPDALERARALARGLGVTVETACRDVEQDPRIEAERYDLVVVIRFLHRPLLPIIRAAARRGGAVIYETFHERTRETGLPPRSEAHLLKTGELREAFEGFEVLEARDAFPLDGRYVSSIVARRP